jgi:DNA-binding PadR family transcriptional regulator
LQRLRNRGLIRTEWRQTENNRRGRYYILTPAGERQLREEAKEWERSSSAVNWVLAWNSGTL